MRKHYRFEDCLLDGDARELSRAGEPVEIEPKTFELLMLLAGQPEHTFTKDEIAGALWPERIISDSVIAQSVSKARQAVGDSVTEQRIIKTIHGVGYRFMAPLQAPKTASHPEPLPSSYFKARPMLWLLTLAIVGSLLLWLPKRPGQMPQHPIIIAAMPAAETGSASDSIVTALEALLSRGVSEHSDIRIIPGNRTQHMLYALGLDVTGSEEALLAALNDSLGADYLMQTRIDKMESGYQVRARILGLDGEVEELHLPAADIVSMVRGFSQQLAGELDTQWHEAVGVSMLSDDNFVNEAYTRALNALLNGENQTAALLFESVLSLDPEMIFARYELGNAFWHLGDHDQARGHYRSVLDQARAKNAPRLAGHSATMLGVLAWQSGDFDQAEHFYEEALKSYELIGDHHGAASTLGNLGNLADSRGDLSRAADLHSLARVRFRAAGDHVGESATYTNLAVISRLRSRLHEARELQSQAVEMQRRLGIGSMLVRSLTYLAAIECELGRCNLARDLLDEAVELAEAHGNRQGLAEIELEQARIALGDLQAGLAQNHAEAARAAFSELGLPAGEVLAMSILAETALLTGDLPTAARWLEAAETTDTNVSKPRDRAHRQLLRLRLAWQLNDTENVSAHLNSLIEQEDRVVAARAMAALAESLWMDDRTVEAITQWQGALEELEAHDDPLVRARIRTRLARALIELGDLERADLLLAYVHDWNPQDASATIQRARWHLVRNESEQANRLISQLRERLAEPPLDPYYEAFH